MQKRSLWFLSVAVVLSATGCGQSAAPADSGSDTGAAEAAAPGPTPCMNGAEFVSNTTTVTFGGSIGNNYAPRCLIVPAGSTVTFNGDFASHPLAPSTRGSTGNPVTSTATGTTASFTYPTAGDYPYFCVAHGTNEGVGMAGVVRVQ